MAEKSQIATTIEQSKRLLAAGIDPKSADMSWVTIDTPWRKESKTDVVLTIGNPLPRCTPAWSLSRLWDAFGLDVLGGWFSVGSSTSEDVIEELVRMVERRISSSK